MLDHIYYFAEKRTARDSFSTRNWGAPLVRQFELSSGCRVIVLVQAMFCKFKRLCNYWELSENDLIFNFYLYCMKL